MKKFFISRRLQDATLWFQFYLSFDKKKDFKKLEEKRKERNLTKVQIFETLDFWKYSLFRSLEGLNQYKMDYIKKLEELEKETLQAKNEKYISEICSEVINDEIKINRRTCIPKYYEKFCQIYYILSIKEIIFWQNH